MHCAAALAADVDTRTCADMANDCEHITHPEYWLGDCGDVARHFFPVPMSQHVANTTLATLVGCIGIDPTKVELDFTGHRFPIQ